MIELQHLTKQYGEQVAVRDLSLTVGAPARAPACTSSLTAPDCPSSAKVSGPRRNMGAEGDAAGGSSISAWTGPV